MKFLKSLLLLAFCACSPVFADWQMKEGPLMTRWASEIDINAPFPDYPRPQLVREQWLNLNGIWQFQSGSQGDSAPVGQTLSDEILVPFAMESAISGVMEYHDRSWYKRYFEVPSEWSGKNLLLHLDAVDWESEVFINGSSVAVHKGGYDPFILDITPYVTASGPQELIVRVYDPTDAKGYPRGKQTLYPGGIMYTSVSGIWQSVWLEPVDSAAVSDLKMTPDIDSSTLSLAVNTLDGAANEVEVIVSAEGQYVTTVTGTANTEMTISIPDQRLWSPDDPFLYDMEISVLKNGQAVDTIGSYFGMRKSSLEADDDGVLKMFLNNEFVFQMGPLDQGYWPDGLYTAPTEEALKYDIIMTKEFGFNMTRKHIKVEPARWYYWADKLGLMVWQDMPSSNSYTGSIQPVDTDQYELELNRMLDNCWNYPSIVSWVVFNEGQGPQPDYDTVYLVNMVKDRDPSRLVNQGSGGWHYGVGDILDYHSYPPPNYPISSTMARVCGEYGGIGYAIEGHLWNPAKATGIYSNTNNPLELVSRYSEYHTSLLNFKAKYGLSAAVYTEITDVENEINGLMTYDRIIKADPSLVANLNRMAIEGKLIVDKIVPTSEDSPQSWSYTTSTPANDWYETGFNDSGWSTGNGGFGTNGTPNTTVRTTWNTSDIWLRRSFEIGDFSQEMINTMSLAIFYDEDVEVYINGVLAAAVAGFSTSYVELAISDEAKAAIIPGGENVFAVHCHQTDGGQYIDLGLSIFRAVYNAPFLPEDYMSYWKMDDGSGTVAIDSYGNNDGAVDGAGWSTDGIYGQSIAFDGINDSVVAAREIADDFTISFWTKTTQTAGGVDQWWQGNGIVDADVPFTDNDFGVSLVNSKIGFGIGNTDTTILSQTSVNDGQWHQIVATRERESGIFKLYIDGVLEAEGVGNTNSIGASSLIRFGAMAPEEHYFEGLLDEVKIYDRALGDLEISALYGYLADVPQAPQSVYVIDGTTQCTLFWADAFVAESYILKRALAEDGPYEVIAAIAGNKYVDTEVEFDTEYYYVVSAVNPVGESVDSEPVMFKSSLVKVHFDAASLLEELSYGEAVSQWPDISGNNNNAVQNTAGREPLFETNSINGHPAVRFINSRQSFLAFERPVTDDFTIAMVYKSGQGLDNAEYFYNGAGLVNAEMPGETNDFGMSLNAAGKVIAGTGSPDVHAVSDGGYNDNQTHIVVFKRTRDSGEIDLYIDGELAATAEGGTQALNAATRVVIGAQQTEERYLTGSIAEVIVYSIALDDDMREAVEAELTDRYIDGHPTPGTNPVPSVGFKPVSVNPILSWSPGSAVDSYEVYLSTDVEPAPVGITSDTYFDTSRLEPDTVYYWGVIARNSVGIVPSELWSFHTAIAGDMEPDGDVDLNDFAAMSTSWMDLCGEYNSWCLSSDINGSSDVDIDDIAQLAQNWMTAE